MEQDKIKHLDFIQTIINRMNLNSFQIKGWTTVILSALLALYASTENEILIIVCIIPTIVFWFLDSYYLMLERKFRGLYKDISGITQTQPNLKPFEMRPDLYSEGEYRFSKNLTAPSVISLYLPTLLLIIIGFIYLKY